MVKNHWESFYRFENWTKKMSKNEILGYFMRKYNFVTIIENYRVVVKKIFFNLL